MPLKFAYFLVNDWPATRLAPVPPPLMKARRGAWRDRRPASATTRQIRALADKE